MQTINSNGVEREATQEEIDTILAERNAPPTPPVPSVITAQQFFIQLVIAGIATEEQAVARTIPALINTALNSLPPEQALAARITWAQMTEIPRSDPLFMLVGPVLEMSEADIDDFFRAAGAIP